MTTTPTSYTFHVDGGLGDHWSSWLDQLSVSRRDDGTSTLVGPIADQAQLHGVLARLRDLGVTVLSVQSDAVHEPPSPALAGPIETERLVLRPGTPQDAEPTFAYRRLEPVARWLTSLPTDLEAYRAKFVDPERLAATVVVLHEGRLVGDLMLRVEDAWSQSEVEVGARRQQAELGWVLDPACTGQGFATEAVRALVRHAFAELGVRRLTANCFADNEASWRLMERLGMRRESHLVQEALHRSGEWLDSYTYALLREDLVDPEDLED